MTPLAAIALAISLAATIAGVSCFTYGVVRLSKRLRLGQGAQERLRPVGKRTWGLLREALSHRAFKSRPVVRVAHWFVMLSFPVLVLTLVAAYFQLGDPHFELPGLGRFAPFTWLVEIFAWGGLFGISALMLVRTRARRHSQTDSPTRFRLSRFAGSTSWHARYVEWTILAVVGCVLALRALEWALAGGSGHENKWLFPLTWFVGQPLVGTSAAQLRTAIILVALGKILVSNAWFIVVGLSPAMGVAWHRFLALPNLYARREADGGKALGAAAELRVDGQAVTAETLDDLPDDAPLGVGTITDFTWKGLLDFSTCTECGRCQELCPAWNTGKPLSPKLFTLALRDHHHAVAPFLQAAADATGATPAAADGGQAEEATAGAGGGPEVVHSGDVLGALLAAGATGQAPGQPGPLIDNVIPADVLWSCTQCGACVDQCPVDIEHVDHILNLRRHQVLMASAFPSELGKVFRGLETKGNPWNAAARKRLDWAKGLAFEVPVLGVDIEDATEVDYVLWVGCAGAFDDRAKRTTAAIAELLHTAGVSFAVLGDGESCTGDPARRAGNEVLFQMLAAANIEALNEARAQRIIVSCAHCFNTIAREYPALGGRYETLHHTQVLNALVRDGRLRPVAPPADQRRDVTFHDPCFLGRHNQIYTPPRELLGAAVGGEQVVEMPRTQERAMCCGGGGARVWMEEKLGVSIGATRAAEAISTGAEVIATACPFCTTMLSDGAAKAASAADGAPGTAPQVKDVAVLMLEAVRRGQPAAPDADQAPSD
ncbi:(Fe-S)-binding protein [Buchananella hordeovulneris]|uniref:Fe-S oxidoreductase n=1 Tax=Buchananella hordeovulneris TaxID=52770 RepID=A0A1Q5PV30_9ACTO|nr:heterodisulfide reductase-related iron-sulfur binding cluster [Buchananella hordeovulneris]OKL51356.1 Fe-S oxidoreductase [Buchananella hordeovulneris]